MCSTCRVVGLISFANFESHIPPFLKSVLAILNFTPFLAEKTKNRLKKTVVTKDGHHCCIRAFMLRTFQGLPNVLKRYSATSRKLLLNNITEVLFLVLKGTLALDFFVPVFRTDQTYRGQIIRLLSVFNFVLEFADLFELFNIRR
jgi:hypothetical protein